MRLGGYTLDDVAGVSVAAALRERLGAGAVRVVALPHATAATGMVPGASPELATIPAEAFESLRGDYFDNITLSGSPAVSRSDRNVDFRWTLNSPARGIPFDWYSVRWNGRLIGRNGLPAETRSQEVPGRYFASFTVPPALLRPGAPLRPSTPAARAESIIARVRALCPHIFWPTAL